MPTTIALARVWMDTFSIITIGTMAIMDSGLVFGSPIFIDVI
jgi:hypothetical protein